MAAARSLNPGKEPAAGRHKQTLAFPPAQADGAGLAAKMYGMIRLYGPAIAVWAVAWLCYWSTACSTLVSYSDSAELIAASYTLGVPHAPGYPLYMMLGKVWSFMTGGDVARRYSLLSGMWGSLAVMMIFLSVKRLTGSVAAAVAGAACLGFSYHFWLYSLIPEISSLNALFGACLVYWTTRQSGGTAGPLAVGVLGFMCGLGLTHHHTLLLWFPALAYFLAVSRPGRKYGFRDFLLLFGCAAAGLLPYLYLPLAAAGSPVINALRDSGVGGVIRFILRRDYGSLVLASEYQTLSGEVVFASLNYYFSCLLRSFYWSGVVLGVLGIYHMRRRKEGVFLLLAFLLSGPFLFAISRMPARTFAEQGVLEKLLSLSWIPWAVFVGAGTSRLLTAVGQKSRVFRAVVIAILCLPPLWAVIANRPRVDKSRFALSRIYAEDLFKCVNRNGILLIHGDSSLFSARYLQAVEGVRTDIEVFNTSDLPDEIIRRNLGLRPVYIVGLPGSEFSQMGVNGNPYYLKPRALVFEVTSEPPEYSDDQSLWESFAFHNQWKITDFEDAYARETLWLYAIAHYNNAAMILPCNRVREAWAEIQRALEIYPDFPEARRFIERYFSHVGR